MNLPQPSEIVQARKAVDLEEIANSEPAARLMRRCWTGKGWHKDEVVFGILIGLQIAQDREGADR